MEPTKEQERCPTCDRVWSDPIGRYCSNSWHLATPDIMRQLSRLQSENERAQQELQAYRDKLKAAISKRMGEVDPAFALAYYDITQLIDTVK